MNSVITWTYCGSVSPAAFTLVDSTNELRLYIITAAALRSALSSGAACEMIAGGSIGCGCAGLLFGLTEIKKDNCAAESRPARPPPYLPSSDNPVPCQNLNRVCASATLTFSPRRGRPWCPLWKLSTPFRSILRRRRDALKRLA